MLAWKKLHGSYENEKGRLIIILVFKTKIFMDPLKIARSSENLVRLFIFFLILFQVCQIDNFRIKTFCYILLKPLLFDHSLPLRQVSWKLSTTDCAQKTNILDVLSTQALFYKVSHTIIG